MIVLKDYQKKAVEDLMEELIYKSKRENNKSTLKAPMGAGKTIIVSSFIKKLIDLDENYIFFWTGIADGGLIKQNMNKMNSYFSFINTVSLDGDSIKTLNNGFETNSVYYVSSQMLKSGTRIFEEGDFLGFDSLLQKSKNNNQKIILIVDEAHIGSDTELFKDLISKIQPNFELHVTATPTSDADTVIALKSVINEEMIKKSVYVNYLENYIEEDKSNIIKLAYLQRNKLKASYESEGSKVNPLVLIQISDSKKGIEETKKIELELKNIGVDESKIAYYLDKNKSNCENIELLDNEIEFLFFKKAISTGWDCPRSQILVKERLEQSGKSSFDLQVLGRIIRTPELKHYNDEMLNKGYIYTLQESVTVLEDFENSNNANIKFYHNTIKKELDNFTSKICTNLKYNKIIITNDYINNDDKIMRNILDKTIGSELGINKQKRPLSDILNEYPCDFNTKIISDDVETSDEKIVFKETINITNKDIFNKYFNDFILSSCKNESVLILYEYILEYLEDYFEKMITNNSNDDLLIQVKNSILINEELKKNIIQAIIDCKNKEFVIKGNKEIRSFDSFIIENESSKFPNTFEYTKNIFKIKQALNLNSNEKRFADYLDKSIDVKWWHKNGDNGENHFSIDYYDTQLNEEKLFFIDFIVYYNDGTYGVFDPKNVTTNNKDKYDSLRKHVKNNNNISKYGLINAENDSIKILTKKEWSANISEWELL